MQYNIVFHVDNDPASMNIAMANIDNTIKALPLEDRTLVLVVNGPGAKLTTLDGAHAGQLAEIMNQGVAVRVCENAMKKFDLALADLVPGCVPVPGAILELANLQRQGFAYIKP